MVALHGRWIGINNVVESLRERRWDRNGVVVIICEGWGDHEGGCGGSAIVLQRGSVTGGGRRQGDHAAAPQQELPMV